MIMGDLSFLGHDASLLAISGAIFATLLKYWWDFRKESARKRMEIYEKLRKGFDEEEDFYPIFDALDARSDASTEQAKQAADAQISAIDSKLRARFAAYIEDVALYAKSNIFSYELANYEFGDYTRMCWEAPSFWEDLVSPQKNQKTEPLWAMYKEFEARINVCNVRLEEKPDDEIRKIRI
jgi:hypothetical protein